MKLTHHEKIILMEGLQYLLTKQDDPQATNEDYVILDNILEKLEKELM